MSSPLSPEGTISSPQMSLQHPPLATAQKSCILFSLSCTKTKATTRASDSKRQREEEEEEDKEEVEEELISLLNLTERY